METRKQGVHSLQSSSQEQLRPEAKEGLTESEVGTKQAAQAQPYVPGAVGVTRTLQHTCP